MTAPRLVTRADDLGSFRSANRAIRESIADGVCRNAGVMATTPQVEDAAELLAGRTDVCFGLHATVTSEWGTHRWGPLLPPERVPCLVEDDGTFLRNPMQIFERGVVFEQVLEEMRAQLARARELGFDVRYVDTHMGFDWLHPQDDKSQRLSDVLQDWAHDEGLVYYQQFPDIERFPKHESIDGYIQAIGELADDRVYLLVEHPCYDDEEMRAVGRDADSAGSEGANRDLQRRHFTDPDAIAALTARGVVPTRYDEL